MKYSKKLIKFRNKPK